MAVIEEDGVDIKALESRYADRVRHDPSDLDAARRIAQDEDKVRIGVLYRNESLPTYEETRRVSAQTAAEKIAILLRAKSKYYHHGIRDWKILDQLAEGISDWKGFPAHRQ